MYRPPSSIMSGLDRRVFAEGKARAIHSVGRAMDARVKYGHDSGVVTGAGDGRANDGLEGEGNADAGDATAPEFPTTVIPGLDPGIHGADGAVDARIEPGHDN